MSEQERKKAVNELNRARLAEQVLNNPLYREAFDLIRANLIDKFEKTKFDQKEERDEIWRKMQIVNSMQEHFQYVMENGKMAEETLSFLDKMKQRIG